MFDTFMSKDKKISLQLKNGACVLKEYVVGDYVDDPAFKDGIYVGLEGFVIILNSKVELVTESKEDLGAYKNLPVFSKWGEEIDDISIF